VKMIFPYFHIFSHITTYDLHDTYTTPTLVLHRPKDHCPRFSLSSPPQTLILDGFPRGAHLAVPTLLSQLYNILQAKTYSLLLGHPCSLPNVDVLQNLNLVKFEQNWPDQLAHVFSTHFPRQGLEAQRLPGAWFPVLLVKRYRCKMDSLCQQLPENTMNEFNDLRIT